MRKRITKMKSSAKSKIMILISLGILFAFPILINANFSYFGGYNYENLEVDNEPKLKRAGYWNLTGSPIYIDGNADWASKASGEDWCSGSGSWADPYVIENITIDGQGSGNCIEIRNSDTYFVIRNCSLYNSGMIDWGVDWYAGIKLDNVDNGKIINNNCCDNNGNGIYLRYSNNNTISENNVSYNNYYGIFLSESINNTISGNLMNFCGIYLYGSLVEMASHSIDNTNRVNNKPVYYYVNETGLGSSNFTGAGQIILINCNNSIISGLNISDGSGISLYYCVNNTLSGINASNNNNIGIYLEYSANNTILGNNASNNKYSGIAIWYSNNNTLSGNTANNNGGGICIENSNNNTISGNTASNNNYYGIRLWNSANNTLSGNLMNFCGISLYGSLVEMASHSIDNTNRVNNKQVYYYVNEIGLGSSNFTGAGQIILINCSNSIISGENLSNGTTGIYLGYSNNNTLSGNTASNNKYYGMYLGYSDNNTLSGNTASNNNNDGIRLYYSDNNTLSGNNASNNSWYGMYLGYSDNNTLSGNTASNNNYNGIYLPCSNNNTISGNTASNNNDHGLYLWYSDNSKIFLNHFINNEINAEDNGINNKWDNGIIGNYWDDYAGVDANDDGIGDTPYIIPGTAGSRDNFPMWADGDDIAPVITIIFPLPDSVFGLVAPNYNISIDELNLDTIWYTLDGGGTDYTITGLTGTFNQTAWEALSEGSLTIRFYANDTAGNIGFIDVEVIIEISEDQPIISFGNYYLLFTFITILSFIILEKRKKK